MKSLEEMLGLDPQSPDMVRAEHLAANDRALLRELVAIRKERRLTQQQVGEVMGISQPSVAAFEAYNSNPTLAQIRRYAQAVRALIVHRVSPDEGQLMDDRRDGWVATSIRNHRLESVAEVAHSGASVAFSLSGVARFRRAADGVPHALALAA